MGGQVGGADCDIGAAPAGDEPSRRSPCGPACTGAPSRNIARGIEPPAYGPRSPRLTKLTLFERYLRERIAAVPELTRSRLCREIYAGGYTALKDFLRCVHDLPPALRSVSRRRPAVRRKWISLISARSLPTSRGPSGSSGCSRSCGHSRMMWGRFPRTHATTRRVVAEHFAEELPHLQALPAVPGGAATRAAYHSRRHDLAARQSLQRAQCNPPQDRRGPQHRQRGSHPRGRTPPPAVAARAVRSSTGRPQ